MLLTVANLDRIGPARAKNPNRISIWAYEVSIACSECSKQEPVVPPPKFWKRIFSRESSSLSSPSFTPTLPPSPTKTSPTKRTSYMPSLRSKASMATTKPRNSDTYSHSHSPPTSPTSTSTANTLTLTLSSPKTQPSHPLFNHPPPIHLSSNTDEMSRTAMYAPGLEADWACDDWGEDENGDSSLDMASSESGAGWGARDRAQRLDRAERLLNTNEKKTKMMAVRQGMAVGVA